MGTRHVGQGWQRSRRRWALARQGLAGEGPQGFDSGPGQRRLTQEQLGRRRASHAARAPRIHGHHAVQDTDSVGQPIVVNHSLNS